jgi:hypothetical protein
LIGGLLDWCALLLAAEGDFNATFDLFFSCKVRLFIFIEVFEDLKIPLAV